MSAANLGIPGAIYGFRNRLINGAFGIDQRLVTAPADDVYVHDRWYALTQSNAITAGTQANPENGQSKCIRLTQSNAGAQRIGLAQIIESTNCIDLRSVACALSGRVRISNSQALRWAILEWVSTADAVTSDVVNDWTSSTYTAGNFFIANVNVVASGTMTPGAATWTALNATTGSPSASMTNLIVFVWTDGTAAQNVTLDVGLMQLEAGVTSTAFERRPSGMELALCQRYYEKSFNLGTAPAQNSAVFQGATFLTIAGASGTINYAVIYKVSKRGNATATTFNPSATNAEARNVSGSADCGSTSTSNLGQNGFLLITIANGGASAGQLAAVHWTGESEL